MLNEIKSIATGKGQTFEQAAAHFGMSRYQLRRIALGTSPGSVDFWREMIKWSSGRVTPNARFSSEIEAAQQDGAAA